MPGRFEPTASGAKRTLDAPDAVPDNRLPERRGPGRTWLRSGYWNRGRYNYCKMTLTIPDDVLAAAHLTEEQLKRELALALFREERLTLAQAARLAEMDQLAFQGLLADRDIPIHYGVEEFHEDLRTLDEMGRR